MSKLLTETDKKSESWWVWSAWTGSSEEPRFVYGCAAQSHRAPGWQHEQTFDLSGQYLTICQTMVSGTDFQHFKSRLKDGEICLSRIQSGHKPAQVVAATRQVFQEALGHGRVCSELYYTLPPIETWEGTEQSASSILGVLKDELNLPFTDRYASRLGNFEVFHLPYWLEMDPPIISEFIRHPPENPDQPPTLEICRSSDLAKQTHIAHLICYNDGDIIADCLVNLPPSKIRQAIHLAEDPDSLELWIFSMDNDKGLIFYEKSNFIRQIGFTMNIPGATVRIQDNLSNRAQQVTSEAQNKISDVTSKHSHRSLVGASQEGSWRFFAKKMRDFSEKSFPEISEDKWFPKGIDGEVGAILHFEKMLNGAAIERAILADPWFGSDSVERLLLRLTSKDLNLHILTSWASVDPDTNTELPPGDKATELLKKALEKSHPFINPNLTVTNIVKKKSQAFHDRYLVIYPHEGPSKTFLLSNSINKMAGNWPFAMSLLSNPSGLEIRDYIEGLCRGIDIARDRPLDETFKWPSNEK